MEEKEKENHLLAMSLFPRKPQIIREVQEAGIEKRILEIQNIVTY